MGHYFVNDDNLKSEIREFKINFLNQDFVFKTDNGVFSKGELDYGTYLLLTTVLNLNIKGKVLDLGCGYGAIGVVISKLKNTKVTMVDVNKRAVHLSKMNVSDNKCDCLVINSEGYLNVSDKFDYIITNPPIRVGKTKLYELMIDSKNYLNENGVIYLVIRKEQGAKSFIKDMSEYYNVNVLEKSKGFYIISLKCC